MKKNSIKIIALAIVCVMALTMFVGCDKKTPVTSAKPTPTPAPTAEGTSVVTSLCNTIKEMSEVEKCDFSVIANINFAVAPTEETDPEQTESGLASLLSAMDLTLKCSGKYNGPTSCLINLEYNTDGSENFSPITSIVVVGEKTYINVKNLLATIASVTGNSELTQIVTGEGSFYELDTSSVSQLTGVELPDVNKEEVTSLINDIVILITQSVNDLVNDADPAVVTETNGIYTVTISDKNIDTLVHNFGTLVDEELLATLDALIIKYPQTETAEEGTFTVAGILRQLKATLEEKDESGKAKIDQIVETLKSFEFAKAYEHNSFNITSIIKKTETDGRKNFDTTLAIKAETLKQKIECGFLMTISELENDITIGAPTSLISTSEKEIIDELLKNPEGALRPTDEPSTAPAPSDESTTPAPSAEPTTPAPSAEPTTPAPSAEPTESSVQ